MNNIVTLIKSEKPDLKEATLKQYVRCLEKIYEKIGNGEEGLSYLKNKDKVQEFMDTGNRSGGPLAEKTRGNYYTSIITILQSENPRDKEVISYYQKLSKNVIINYQKKNEEGIISDKQSKDFVSVEKVDQLIKILKTKNTIGYLLFLFLKHHHLRNEIAELKKISLKEFKKLKSEDKVGNNYLVVGSKKIYMSRNDYKTYKTYGENVSDIEDKTLHKELRKHLNDVDDGEDVFDFPGEKTEDKRNQLSHFLRHLSNKYIGTADHPVHLSTTILAKIYMSKKFIEPSLEQQKVSSERGHSIATENLVYLKKIN